MHLEKQLDKCPEATRPFCFHSSADAENIEIRCEGLHEERQLA
jgi:hypothetical protein